MKIDPYKHKEKYLRWKESVSEGILDVSPTNSEIILQYIYDMERGLNVSSKSIKGPRSYVRLNNLKQRIIFLAKLIEKNFEKDIVDVSEEELFELFHAMLNGKLLRQDGEKYQSVVDYIKPFKAFWHWHIKVQRKRGYSVEDITQDLDTSQSKPKWVYLTPEQITKLCDHARFEYKVLMMFMYDSGIRSPTELINIRVSDLYDNYTKVHIREEIAKKGSFGRKINLLLSTDLLKRYIKERKLHPQDQLFNIIPTVTNRYLKRLAKRILGKRVSPAGESYDHLTMYDFRHCSCCYWLPRYKSESALKYRFGWRKSDKIHYYSELLGMKDTISEEDILIDVSKTEIEKRLLKTERENRILKDEIESLNRELVEIKKMVHGKEVSKKLQNITLS